MFAPIRILVFLLFLTYFQAYLVHDKNTFRYKQLRPQFKHISKSKTSPFVSRSALNMGVEHLVTCGIDSNIFNDGSASCLAGTTTEVIQNFAWDMLGSISTMGLLVATYFYIRRIQSADVMLGQDVDHFERLRSSVCPKCNGTGRNLFRRSAICKLCDGTGEVDIVSSTMSLTLPSRSDSRFDDE